MTAHTCHSDDPVSGPQESREVRADRQDLWVQHSEPEPPVVTVRAMGLKEQHLANTWKQQITLYLLKLQISFNQNL